MNPLGKLVKSTFIFHGQRGLIDIYGEISCKSKTVYSYLWRTFTFYFPIRKIYIYNYFQIESGLIVAQSGTDV